MLLPSARLVARDPSEQASDRHEKLGARTLARTARWATSRQLNFGQRKETERILATCRYIYRPFLSVLRSYSCLPSTLINTSSSRVLPGRCSCVRVSVGGCNVTVPSYNKFKCTCRRHRDPQATAFARRSPHSQRDRCMPEAPKRPGVPRIGFRCLWTRLFHPCRFRTCTAVLSSRSWPDCITRLEWCGGITMDLGMRCESGVIGLDDRSNVQKQRRENMAKQLLRYELRSADELEAYKLPRGKRNGPCRGWFRSRRATSALARFTRCPQLRSTATQRGESQGCATSFDAPTRSSSSAKTFNARNRKPSGSPPVKTPRQTWFENEVKEDVKTMGPSIRAPSVVVLSSHRQCATIRRQSNVTAHK